MSNKKTYTNRDVSRIVQRRTEELRDKLNGLKSENAVLKEVLITAFKDWFKEQKAEEERK